MNVGSVQISCIAKLSYLTMKIQPLACTIILVNLFGCSFAIDEWQKLYHNLYSIGGKELSPTETLEILKRLEEVGPNSDSSDIEKKNIDFLLDSSQYSEPKCARSYFYSLNALITKNADYQHSVIPYLRFHRRQLFQFCQQNYGDKAKSDLAKLNKETSKGVALLKQKVILANGGKIEKFYDDYSNEALARGIKFYLDSQTNKNSEIKNSIFRKTITKQSYVQFANTHLRDYCNNYTATFQPKLSFGDYKQFNDDELMKMIEPTQFENLVELKICLSIKPKFNYLLDQAFDILQKD